MELYRKWAEYRQKILPKHQTLYLAPHFRNFYKIYHILGHKTNLKYGKIEISTSDERKKTYNEQQTNSAEIKQIIIEWWINMSKKESRN